MSDADDAQPRPHEPVYMLAGYAEPLWDPIIALMAALVRISNEPLSAGQRTLVAGMMADAEGMARRAEVLVLSTPTSPPPPALVPELANEPLSVQRATVLVVDDDPVWLESARELLSRFHDVLTAGDGQEALELMHKHHPDAVVTDLSMPRVGGLGLLEAARATEEMAQVPFLVLSATSDSETKVQAFEAGAFDYVTKPAPPAELVMRLRKALDNAQALRRERRLQETDDLTGLPNRRSLRAFLAAALRETRTGQPLAVAMVDQDGLKQINDRYGHPAGDLAIRAVAGALQRCKRGSDFAARLGGDEFVVVMPGADRAGAEKLAARLQADLDDQPLELAEGRLRLTASFGLAVAGEVAWTETWEQLVERADEALYRQKAEKKARAGLNQIPRARPATGGPAARGGGGAAPR
ncbi:MAG TPA: diguanylate cyclase [Myxococcaceae bacterium]|nr:diguanylate cyclase [Myxococcaceae bacterium]